jgi:protein phosphatase
MTKNIAIPELSLVALVGISGSGKSTFARKHFRETEIISSDRCRAIVSDDENNQAATNDAFEVLHYIAAKRLKNGLLTVIDATNIQPTSRESLIRLAKEYHCIPVAIVLDVPEDICLERNRSRPDRNLGHYVIAQQRSQLRRSIKKLKEEGFRHIYILKSEDEIDSAIVVKEKLYNDKKHITGPFDIIGDIHGCFLELTELLEKLGYSVQAITPTHTNFGFDVKAPEGRTAVFLGDLVDRGPDSPAVLRLVMSMVHAGVAYCVPGNHDMKLHKYLNGKSVVLKHGLERTVEQLKDESPEFIRSVKDFLNDLVSHYVFDRGKLVVAHAGLREDMQGRGSGAVRSFAMFGETTGETDEFGLPVRYNWALEYRGKAMVVYGHTPVPESQWLNHTIDIDTGCVFGGKLTALRYPEEEIVSVAAKDVYYIPSRPIGFELEQSKLNLQQQHDDILDIRDVTGKRIITTRLRNSVTVNEENSIAALEVMSRFAVNPKWLIYLPPTMSPSETSTLEDYLEHPLEAFDYFRRQGICKVVCEQKHMGSRAVIIIGKDAFVIRNRFGIEHEGIGICYTRTGRNFFNDSVLERHFLERLNNALKKSNFWEELNTDWVCLDAELMPWSVKAQALLKDQYAAVGASASAALADVVDALSHTVGRGIEGIDQLLNKYTAKQVLIDKYIQAYQEYCWPVNSVNDLRLAPFHILATEGAVHTDKNHEWHMSNIESFCRADADFLTATPYQVIDVSDESAIQSVVDSWFNLTQNGGEGIVIKPYDFISHGKKGLVQPAIKCRGKEYLRIIYGPEYTLPENIVRLKKRGVSAKRSLALREFALGIEALERFVKKEPLRKVHECVFGVLALESEEVDPRL